MLGPAHLVIFIHTRDPVQQPLDRPQHRIHKCPLPAEHMRHENAHRLGDSKDEREEEQNLEPAIGRHIRISPDATVRTAGTPWSEH